MLSKGLLETASQWASMDPNPLTSIHIKNLINTSEKSSSPEASASLAKLQDIFSSRISFGTAGLRSKFQPGPRGMNDLTVIQTSQGLARFCQSRGGGSEGDSNKMKAVIG